MRLLVAWVALVLSVIGVLVGMLGAVAGSVDDGLDVRIDAEGL